MADYFLVRFDDVLVEIKDILFDLLILSAEIGLFEVELVDLFNWLLVVQTALENSVVVLHLILLLKHIEQFIYAFSSSNESIDQKVATDGA